MKYLTKYWKTIAALVYINIVILDFIVFPGYFMFLDREYEVYAVRMIELLQDQPEILKQVLYFKPQDWMPFTLRGAGLFHIAFGAILTGTILGRNRKNGNGNGK